MIESCLEPPLFLAMVKIQKYLFFLFPLVTCACAKLGAQELPARQSYAISGTFSPDSSHMLIGQAEQRRTWTTSLEYGRTIWGNSVARIDYEGSITPFFQERDPTIVGAFTDVGGSETMVPIQEKRVIAVSHNPIGEVSIGGPPVPLYGIYSSEKTYAFSVSPIGARVNFYNSRHLQPTFSTDLGLVFSGRDLPVDDSARLNYLFSFGPGIEFFYKKNEAVRLEYLYRHMSNGGSGDLNPGVDQGVIRLTLSFRHR